MFSIRHWLCFLVRDRSYGYNVESPNGFVAGLSVPFMRSQARRRSKAGDGQLLNEASWSVCR